ncbi:hypothetical protein EX30DRAFT_128626 [Ascodesmis nigricans]|uniref:Uncharacterized protein n=1 Tax=Ascodesmis nigricans TaxID=341454 RepID=A0A4S2MNY8_9PEZI|nr:hypothetical protein EX30DRAFT_128626 [Ascodesmis nigricans]
MPYHIRFLKWIQVKASFFCFIWFLELWHAAAKHDAELIRSQLGPIGSIRSSALTLSGIWYCTTVEEPIPLRKPRSNGGKNDYGAMMRIMGGLLQMT